MFGGGGGGGGGGRRMVRVVGRAVTSNSVGSVCGGITPTVSASSSSDTIHLSFSSNSSLSSTHHYNNPILHCTQQNHKHNDDDDDHIFSVVPSETEVDAALSALNQVFGPASYSQLGRDKSNSNLDYDSVPGLADQVSSDGSETDWKEPSLFPYNSQVLQADESDRVHYAFHLLQTEPYIQRMVKSLSSDKSVWDAVLNNEVVRELRELRESISADVFQKPNGTYNSDSLTTTNVVMWIFDTGKAKIIEVIEIIIKAVTGLFQPADHKTDAEGPDHINDNLRTAFMLSIMVMLIVLVSRAETRA